MQNISFWLFKVAIYVLNRNFLNIETFYFHSQVWKHHNKRFLELKKNLLKSKYQLIHLTRNTLTSYFKKKKCKKAHLESLESCSVIPMCPVKTLQDMKDEIPTKHTVSGHSSQRKKQSNPFKFLVWIFLFMTVSSFVFHIPKVLYFSLIKKFLNYHLFPSKNPNTLVLSFQYFIKNLTL